MKRPFLAVALWYSAGVLLASLVEVSLVPLFAAAFGAGLLALVRPRLRSLSLTALVFFAGWANLSWRSQVVSPNDLRSLIGERPALVTLRGTLAGATSPRVLERDEREFWHTLVPMDVSAARINHGPWQPAAGQVQTSTKGTDLTNLFLGQMVEVEGVESLPPGPVAQGLFDYRAWLAQQGIYYQLKVDSPDGWQVAGATNPPPWTESFRLWAQGTTARGLPVIDEPLKLQWAMVLGWKTALTSEVSQPFMRSGTMHIFAISGLHIALISGILLALFRLVNLPRSFCGLVVIPLIWFYTAATEWQASAIRSTVMMTIVIAGWSLHRPSDLLNSLAGAAFIILLWDPAQLVQASFQLSFGAVLGIALFMPPLEELRRRWFSPDPLVPEDLRPRWQRWLWAGATWLVKALNTSLAATLGTAPLIAYYFHLFSPISLVSNLVVVPLSGFALMCGLGGVICGGWWAWATELFNHAGWFFMSCMIKASGWSLFAPASYYYVKSPGLLFMGFYYGVLATALGAAFTKRHWRWIVPGLASLAVAWLGCVWHDHHVARVTILPLSGGDAVWLESPGHAQDWLVDCGNANAAERITIPFLRGQGVNRLPHFIVTHGDVLHVGGGTNLMAGFPMKELCASPVSFRSQPYRQLLAVWTNRHGPFHKVATGDSVGPWTVLHPPSNDRSPKADDKALVLRGSFHGTRLLLCSDLGLAGQNALYQRKADLRAEIVVAGLPNGSEPLHNDLLEAIQPGLIIITDDERPASAHSPPKLPLRLARRGVPVLFLRETGAVTLEFRRGQCTAQTMNGLKLPNIALATKPQPR